MMEPVQSASQGEAGTRVDERTLDVIAARIASRAREYGLDAGPAGRVKLTPYRSTSSYPLYLAEVPTARGRPQHVVVKFAPIFGSHREGQAEFTNLRTMAARLGRSEYLHVPRPLDYWEDVNALVTEHRPGRRFSSQILSAPPWPAPRAPLVRTARQCGEWLRIYHDATSHGEGPAIDERFVATMRRDLGRIPPRGPLHALRPRIETALDAITRSLAQVRAPVSVRHGDFCPDNVHIDGDGVCVFDLSHHRTGPVYDDVTFFLVTLDTMNPYPKHWAFNRRVARALADPFLEGYFGEKKSGIEGDRSRVLAAYTLKNLLTRCLRQRGVAASGGAPARAAFDVLWVAGHYRGMLIRAMERATGHN